MAKREKTRREMNRLIKAVKRKRILKMAAPKTFPKRIDEVVVEVQPIAETAE